MTLDPDDLTYPERAGLLQLHADRGRWQAAMAASRGSKSASDLVRLIRGRAHAANRRSLVFLGFLILTILSGFIYYVYLPVSLRLNSADVNATRTAVQFYDNLLGQIDARRDLIFDDLSVLTSRQFKESDMLFFAGATAISTRSDDDSIFRLFVTYTGEVAPSFVESFDIGVSQQVTTFDGPPANMILDSVVTMNSETLVSLGTAVCSNSQTHQNLGQMSF